MKWSADIGRKVFVWLCVTALGKGIWTFLSSNGLHPDRWVATAILNSIVKPAGVVWISSALIGLLAVVGAEMYLWPWLRRRGHDPMSSQATDVSPSSSSSGIAGGARRSPSGLIQGGDGGAGQSWGAGGGGGGGIRIKSDGTVEAGGGGGGGGDTSHGGDGGGPLGGGGGMSPIRSGRPER